MGWFRKLFGKQPAPSPVPAIERVVPVMTVPIPQHSEHVELCQDQVLRKAWAEDVLTAHGVPVNAHLPCIESQAEVQVRTPQEIADRLRALVIVAVKGEGLEQEEVDKVVEAWGGRTLFSPKELAFIDNQAPSDHERLQFSWRYEAAWVMSWALNLTGEPLTFPNSVCDVPALVETLRDTPEITQHGAQPANNILNEADLIYRYHWAVRQASIDGVESPGGLHAGVVMERHKALNWLTGYDEADWDDVTTDT